MKDQLTPPQVIRNYIEGERKATMWGRECDITPRMIDTVFGDGGQLFTVAPLDTRPNYYAILVDSSWDVDELMERSEQIIQAIESQFGNADDENDEGKDGDDDRQEWPAWHDGGFGYHLQLVPEELRQAVADDLAAQRARQRALILQGTRIQQGMLLEHPEFGSVQCRFSEELGWHYVRRGVHEMNVGRDFYGYATDFSVLQIPRDPRFCYRGIDHTVKIVLDVPPPPAAHCTPPASSAAPRRRRP